MSSWNRTGFVLSDLALILGRGAVLLAAPWQGQSGAPGVTDGIAANEREAIAALRSIAAAQAQLASSGAIDTDGDGIGDYGYFGELMGTARLRAYDPAVEYPTIGDATLTPSLLPGDFGIIAWDALNENVVLHDGYVFKMFLPDIELPLPGFPGLHVDAIGEDGPFGIGGCAGATFPDANNAEQLWCCYAWPLEGEASGRRAFFVNQEGRVLQSRNDGHGGRPVYQGLIAPPDPDAAFSVSIELPPGLSGMGAPLGVPPRRANDGNRWTPLGP